MQQTDEDGNITEYEYSPVNLASHVSYTGGAQERKLYIHEDPLGTTKKFTKGDGMEFEALKYDAWDLPAQPNKLLNNDHGNFIAANFAGHTHDTVLDFYFAEARYYDPATRIWAARDPAKDGLNWYRYVGNNPATHNDPSGKFVQIIVGAVVGGIASDAQFKQSMDDYLGYDVMGRMESGRER